MKNNREDSWVADRLATLEPQWSPNLAHGRALLDVKLTQPRRSWIWLAAAATVMACVAVFLLPGPRALAQELWYRFVLKRVDVVRLDLSKLPLHVQVTTNGSEEHVRNTEQARAKAGFMPYLPLAHVMDGSPDITVTGPITMEQTIHVRDIESALLKVGASDIQVPTEWEGVRLRAEIGPMVEANYSDDVRVVQAKSIELSVPPGFALEHFAEVAFRSIGASSSQARDMARKFATDPAWLLDIPPDSGVDVQEVDLRTGRAFLIEELDEKRAVKRVTVLRTTDERMYSVSSRSLEQSTKIADTLP